jgi:hypothetical protein
LKENRWKSKRKRGVRLTKREERKKWVVREVKKKD